MADHLDLPILCLLAASVATGKFGLTSLPPLGGLTLHMVALVESSPGDIAVITDPNVMRLP